MRKKNLKTVCSFLWSKAALNKPAKQVGHSARNFGDWKPALRIFCQLGPYQIFDIASVEMQKD